MNEVVNVQKYPSHIFCWVDGIQMIKDIKTGDHLLGRNYADCGDCVSLN